VRPVSYVRSECPTNAVGLLQNVVARYNDGVRSRDFAPLLGLLADTVVLELVDLPGTSLHGRPIVALALTDAAPAQEVVLRTLSANGDGVFATFSWGGAPARQAGSIRLTVTGDPIGGDVISGIVISLLPDIGRWQLRRWVSDDRSTPRSDVISDRLWALIAETLPTAAGRRGRQWNDHRQTLEAIVWHFRTGSPWRDVPAEFGSWQSVWERHRRWSNDDTYVRIFTALRGHTASEDDATLAGLLSIDPTRVAARAGASRSGTDRSGADRSGADRAGAAGAPG
jgi:putative transposase